MHHKAKNPTIERDTPEVQHIEAKNRYLRSKTLSMDYGAINCTSKQAKDSLIIADIFKPRSKWILETVFKHETIWKDGNLAIAHIA